jgi:Copper type II ascorbate-dependent monooxygenase, C-terminal domain
MRLLNWFLAGGLLASGALAARQWTLNSGIGETRASRHGHAYSSLTKAEQPPLLAFIPTYYRDVEPILAKNCVGCHVDSGIAPFSLEKPEEAVKHAKEAQLAVRAKRMPPWLPGGESPRFKNELKLSDQDVAILANWSWAGAPMGKKSDARANISTSARAQMRGDVVMDIGAPFTPDARLTDEYRCFVVDPKLESERFVTAYDIVPGNKKLVHHVIVFTVEPQRVAEIRQLEQSTDGRGGYPCFGGPGLPTRIGGGSSGGTVGYSILGSWVPGSMGAERAPEGMGTPLKAGTALVLQVHYNLINSAGDRASDRTVAKLDLAPKDAKLTPIRTSLFIAPVEIACPSGISSDPNNACSREAAYKAVEAYQEPELTQVLKSGLFLTYCKTPPKHDNGVTTTTCEFPVSSDRQLLSVQGHMHLLGAAIKLEVNASDAARRRVLLDIPKWDFHWQSGYWFAQPIAISKGDTVRLTCTWDNRSENQMMLNGKRLEPRYIVWGEGTRDEMCLAGFSSSPR